MYIRAEQTKWLYLESEVCCNVKSASFSRHIGVSLDLSQPAAALQSQKAQASTLPLTQNNAGLNTAQQKQVHTDTDKSIHFLIYCIKVHFLCS